jgi:hypothetical protein
VTDSSRTITNASIAGLLSAAGADLERWAEISSEDIKPGADLVSKAIAAACFALAAVFSDRDPATSPFDEVKPEPESKADSDDREEQPEPQRHEPKHRCVDEDGYPTIFYDDLASGVAGFHHPCPSATPPIRKALADTIRYIAEVIEEQTSNRTAADVAGMLDAVATDLEAGHTRSQYEQEHPK